MNINIPQKKLDYLTKKYGNAEAIVQQIVDNWLNVEIQRDYEKKNINLTVDAKLDFIKGK